MDEPKKSGYENYLNGLCSCGAALPDVRGREWRSAVVQCQGCGLCWLAHLAYPETPGLSAPTPPKPAG